MTRSLQMPRIDHALASLLAVILLLLSSGQAAAHAGHAGKPVHFLKERAALKAMLPRHAHVVRRKQGLSESAIDWAQKTYGVELDDDIYTFYPATKRGSGEPLGSATIVEVPYRHGSALIGVGIDAEGRIRKAALLTVNAKYVDAFRSSVGTGLLPAYEGLSIDALNERVAASRQSDDKVRRLVDETVRDTAILLEALKRDMK